MRIRPVRLALFSLLTLVTFSAAQAQRLPAGVTPENYTLALTPDLKAATFTGTESIARSHRCADEDDHAELGRDQRPGRDGGAGLRQLRDGTACGWHGRYDADKQQATFTFPAVAACGQGAC